MVDPFVSLNQHKTDVELMEGIFTNAIWVSCFSESQITKMSKQTLMHLYRIYLQSELSVVTKLLA